MYDDDDDDDCYIKDEPSDKWPMKNGATNEPIKRHHDQNKNASHDSNGLKMVHLCIAVFHYDFLKDGIFNKS